MAYYRVPPPVSNGGYFDYQPSISPSNSGEFNYYIPSSYKSTSRRGSHARTASYSSPKMAPSFTVPAGYPSPGYYSMNPDLSSPPPSLSKYEYVSINPHTRTATRRSSMSTGTSSHIHNSDKRFASVRTATQRIYIDTSDRPHNDSSGAEEPIYVLAEPRLGRKTSTRKSSISTTTTTTIRPKADSKLHFIQTNTDIDTPTRSRARRDSTASKSGSIKTTKTIKPPRQATAEDALDHDIPAGFCLKNWDPVEKPIVLLGSVFDANSLGKWIYDWTVFSHKSQSPLAEVAGELWLLLIKFSGKMQRAEAGIRRVRYQEDKEMLNDFLDSGDRVWRKLKSLIKTCEEAMWEGASKEGSRKVMGQKSGVAFVDTFFGRDGEMDKTERLMTAMRFFNVRFDANCEDILRSLKK